MLCVATVVLAAGAAVAQSSSSWPTRPITLVVAYAAGGPVDTLARIIAARMSELLPQQIVVENVGGAGGMVGTARAAKAAPDGYTVLFGGSGALAQIPNLHKRPSYNAVTDFSAITLLTDSPRVLIARPDLPAKDYDEFVAWVKSNPNVRYGSSGAGAGGHICALLLESAYGVKMTHIPYRGAGPAMQDLIGGRLDFMAEQVSTAAPLIAAGTVKAFAVLGPDRLPVLEKLPAAPDIGLPDLDCGAWSALVAPKGTPEPIIRKLAAVGNEAVESPAVRARFSDIGVVVVAKNRRTTEYLSDFVPKEIARWAGPIAASGAAME
jgi:tripartite-type tricarboxylate transporter receptor subunit TctC